MAVNFAVESSLSIAADGIRWPELSYSGDAIAQSDLPAAVDVAVADLRGVFRVVAQWINMIGAMATIAPPSPLPDGVTVSIKDKANEATMSYDVDKLTEDLSYSKASHLVTVKARPAFKLSPAAFRAYLASVAAFLDGLPS